MSDGTNPARTLLDRKDCALVLIDFQEKLHRVIDDKDRLRDNAVRLTAFAGIAGMPVVVTEQQNLGPTLPEIKEVLPTHSVFDKICFDCFGNEAFRDRLALANRGTLIIAGIEAHICVTQTTLSALSRYQVHVVADAVGSRDPRNREVALARMKEAGAIITSTEMFMYELLREAGTDEFRAALKLVK
jgi:nicotinamidase-related amidase